MPRDPRGERAAGARLAPLAAGVVLAFLGYATSPFIAAAESHFELASWLQLHAAQTLGAYLAWLAIVVPTAFVVTRWDIRIIPAARGRSSRVIEFAVWVSACALLLWLRGHGVLFIAQSSLGAVLAALTIAYRGVLVAKLKRRLLLTGLRRADS